MNAYDLKYKYNSIDGGHFFDRSTMAFFGDTMRNYAITHHKANDVCPHVVELRRKHPVKQGMTGSAYFVLVEGKIDAAVKFNYTA